MPMYDYRCTDCGKTYDVYHKTREIGEDVVCPACGSTKHKRLMSAAMVSVGSVASRHLNDAPPCEGGSGTCCGGSCGSN